MKEIPEELKKIILWKLEADMPSNFKVSIGGEGAFSKKELISHVEKSDPVGCMYADMELRFMKAIMNGDINRELLKE
jgi:hypothetical protein